MVNWLLNITHFYVYKIEDDINEVIKLPPVLHKYPELVDDINKFVSSNVVGDMSSMKMRPHIEKCILIILKDSIIDLNTNDDNTNSIKRDDL